VERRNATCRLRIPFRRGRGRICRRRLPADAAVTRFGRRRRGLSAAGARLGRGTSARRGRGRANDAGLASCSLGHARIRGSSPSEGFGTRRFPKRGFPKASRRGRSANRHDWKASGRDAPAHRPFPRASIRPISRSSAVPVCSGRHSPGFPPSRRARNASWWTRRLSRVLGAGSVSRSWSSFLFGSAQAAVGGDASEDTERFWRSVWRIRRKETFGLAKTPVRRPWSSVRRTGPCGPSVATRVRIGGLRRPCQANP
jgi:hypothetical protein